MHQSDNGADVIAGTGDVVRQRSQHLDVVAGQPDLFLGFAQRRGDAIGVVGFLPASRKTDLPGMGIQIGIALVSSTVRPSERSTSGTSTAASRKRASVVDAIHRSAQAPRPVAKQPVPDEIAMRGADSGAAAVGLDDR
jgi:hypothetical protein